MSRIKLSFALAALLMMGSLSVHADDAAAPTTQESAAATGKIPARYNKLDLTDDQKAKVGEIHEKAASQIREIDKQENADIDALLTDDQKAQLKKIEDDRKAEMKARRAEKRAAKQENATTEKSD